MIERLIRSYYNIVMVKIQDFVPKVIMDMMINLIKNTLQCKLVKELYKPELFNEVLQESEEVEFRRKEASEMLEVRMSCVCFASVVYTTHTIHFL